MVICRVKICQQPVPGATGQWLHQRLNGWGTAWCWDGDEILQLRWLIPLFCWAKKTSFRWCRIWSPSTVLVFCGEFARWTHDALTQLAWVNMFDTKTLNRVRQGDAGSNLVNPLENPKNLPWILYSTTWWSKSLCDFSHQPRFRENSNLKTPAFLEALVDPRSDIHFVGYSFMA